MIAAAKDEPAPRTPWPGLIFQGTEEEFVMNTPNVNGS